MWKGIPYAEEPLIYTEKSFEQEPFVKVTDNEYFDVCMQYPLLQMENAETECWMRLEVKKMLEEAVSYLPKGYKIRIWDAWRPYALQKELYEKYKKNIVTTMGLEKESPERQNQIVCRFVSEPVYNRENSPVHTTGGAIDVTLVNESGQELNMGTMFDAFTEATHTAYFENMEESDVRNNRRLLYQAMIKSGFTNLPSEWWHYDYGDRFWAFYNKMPAKYMGVFTREEINENERKQ